MGRLAYWRRIFAAYVFRKNSQLTFWHEKPTPNPAAYSDVIGEYYMFFQQKAHYPGPFDENCVPLLDYHGEIGLQYNPIAIGQYALAKYNLFAQTGDGEARIIFLKNVDWLMDNMRDTGRGTKMWPHLFNFEYFKRLEAPWYSGLAQGVGISALARAFRLTGDTLYKEAARTAFLPMTLDIEEGGVLHTDARGNVWIEEYLVSPRTHIVNGFMWALWGVRDYWLISGDPKAKKLYETCLVTLMENLPLYDSGFWSYYELTPQRIKSIASPYYHQLHIAQLDVFYNLTGAKEFKKQRDKWQKYAKSPVNKIMAKAYKIAFKIMYY